jgi:hypothetical protein
MSEIRTADDARGDVVKSGVADVASEIRTRRDAVTSP